MSRSDDIDHGRRKARAGFMTLFLDLVKDEMYGAGATRTGTFVVAREKDVDKYIYDGKSWVNTNWRD